MRIGWKKINCVGKKQGDWNFLAIIINEKAQIAASRMKKIPEH